jgi:SPOR domain
MTVAAGTIRRRRNDDEKKLAAKSKRDRVILVVGGVVLLAVLVFEVPKVLSSGSSSAPAPAPATAPAAPTAAAGGAPTAELIRNDLRAISKLPSKNPFQAQLGANTGVTTGTQPLAHGPRVRSSHFAVKNPFKAQLGAPVNATPAAPLATPPPVTSTKATHKAAAASSPFGYIVILRSLDSKAAAQREVKKAHAKGLTSASILYSSKYTTLRHGYWVVYLSKYPTVAAANAGLQDATAHGYASAYQRPVKK